LTTPPCIEAVNWFVSKNVLAIGEADLKALGKPNCDDFGNDNFRGVQELG